MSRLLFQTVLVFLFSWSLASADAQQQSAPYALEWEVVAVDSIPGMTTVRLYAKLVNPTDYLTSVSGWDEMEGYILTTTSFYQHPDGWATPNNNNPLLFVPLPDLRWDSWITIGIDVAPNGVAGEIPVGLFPPQTDLWVDQFEAGGSLVMDIDGAWFVTLGASNGTAGDDLRVLVGQFTTDGVISGQLNLQVFSEGVAADDFLDDVYSITIPEFDAGNVSSLHDPLSADEWKWGLCPLENGGYRHDVGSRVMHWFTVDFTGRRIEEGRVENGRFETTKAGVVVLEGAGDQVLDVRVLR
jgi:hypothetical protein